MTTLVTGGAGIIGAELVHQLVERGEQVVVLDHAHHAPRLALVRDRICYLQADVAEGDVFYTTLRRHDVQVIYHMAAMLGPDSENNPAGSFASNVLGTHKVLEIARRQGVAKVFFASSTGTYGAAAQGVVTDLTPQQPHIVYGVEKLYGEQLGMWYRRRYGMDFRCIRYAQIVGPNAHICWVWLSQMIESAIAGRRYVADFATPGNLISLLYIRDAARAAIQMMQASRQAICTPCCMAVGAADLLTARDAEAALARRYPGFGVQYTRQDQWNNPLERYDDSAARKEWGWDPRWTSFAAVVDVFEQDLRMCPQRFGIALPKSGLVCAAGHELPCGQKAEVQS